MSKYVIIHGQLHEFSDDELMHWKYIKREKKNGKWVYIYPNDKLGIKRFIDTKITGKAYKQHAKEATDKYIATNNERASVSQRRIHAEETSKGYSQEDPKVIELKKRETDLSKKSTDAKNEAAKANANYENKSVSGAVKANIRNLKSNIKDGINSAKDKLGFDERDEYLESKNKYANAKSYLSTAKTDNASVYDYDQKRMVPNTKEYWSKRTSDLGKKYADSKKEYMKTPLGKVAKATTAVEDYIKSLFSKKKTTKSSSSKNVLKENVLKENVIKENVIKENVIKENIIKGDTIEERKKKKK